MCHGSEVLVQGLSHARGGRKVGALQLKANLTSEVGGRRATFYNGSIRNPADRGMIHRLAGRPPPGRISAEHHRTLGDRVDLAIRTPQAGHQKNAALETGAVADGRYGNIDTRSRLSIRR